MKQQEPYELGLTPMTDEQYEKTVGDLPPAAQRKHRNFVALMEAADKGDKDGMKKLLRQFKAQG